MGEGPQSTSAHGAAAQAAVKPASPTDPATQRRHPFDSAATTSPGPSRPLQIFSVSEALSYMDRMAEHLLMAVSVSDHVHE